jgi:hypothetical protein
VTRLRRPKTEALFRQVAPDWEPSERCAVEAWQGLAAPEWTAGDWAVIEAQCDLDNAITNGGDTMPSDLANGERLEEEMERRRQKRRESYPQSQPIRKSVGSDRVGLSNWDDDALRRVPASEYLPALTGNEVSASGRTRCPRPDHEDRNPSAKAYGIRWNCFACNEKGGIYEAASAVYGLRTEGSDFLRLRELIAQALLGVRRDV